MPLFKRKAPAVPSLIVSDARPLNIRLNNNPTTDNNYEHELGNGNENESFIYCPGIESQKIDEFKKTYKRKTDDQYRLDKKYDITFERKHIKDLIHSITAELKKNGTKIPLLILPFRPKQNDEDLKDFLDQIFKNGDCIPIEDALSKEIIRTASPYTLVSALKFLWCRLPGKAVIGWKAYTDFVKLEDDAGFPDKAFLDYMPSCLSTSSHASIVYDFFDLIVALILNSKENLMTAKKLSKLCGLWAFSPVKNKSSSNIPSFERGLYEWIPAGDAMYHLLLSFVKAMPSDGDITKLPKIFQILLKSSDYPPQPTAVSMENSRHLQEIPMVTIRSNKPSKNPAELLTRVNKTLKFDDVTLFYTREDYLLLKRLFKDKDEIVNKLSSEGSRLLENLCLYDTDLISDNQNFKYKLIPGWSIDMTSRCSEETNKKAEDLFTAVVGRATIDDYFIWTWLASLGIEETDFKKKTFGKSYIMEIELAEGFKKWVIVEEQDLKRDGYDLELEIKQEKLKKIEKEIKNAEIEAEKIRKENQLNAQKLEKEKMKEKIREKALQIENTTKLRDLDLSDSTPPPPVPQKDYKNSGIPQRSKSRKPPPSKSKLNNATILSPIIDDTEGDSVIMQPPPRSARRGTSGSLQSDEDRANGLNDVEFDIPIRLSLPEFDTDDDFLKYDTLGIHESDLDSNPSPHKTQFDTPVRSPERLLKKQQATDVIYEEQKVNLKNTTPSPKIPNRSPERYNQLENDLYPVSQSPSKSPTSYHTASPQYTRASPCSPQYMNSPPRSNSPQYMNSPPRSNSPQYRNSPPRTNSPQYRNSPPCTNSPQFRNSPPRTNSPQFRNSPQYSKSPPHSPISSQRGPNPQSMAPTYHNSPPHSSSPKLHQSPYSSNTNISSGNDMRAVDLFDPSIEASNNVLKPLTEISNIPILSPPSQVGSPVKSPVSKENIMEGFEELENDFKDCIKELGGQAFDSEKLTMPIETRKVSGSRTRKPPPNEPAPDIYSEYPSSSIYSSTGPNSRLPSGDQMNDSEYAERKMLETKKYQNHGYEKSTNSNGVSGSAVGKTSYLAIPPEQRQYSKSPPPPSKKYMSQQQQQTPNLNVRQRQSYPATQNPQGYPPLQQFFKPPAQPYAYKSSNKIPSSKNQRPPPNQQQYPSMQMPMMAQPPPGYPPFPQYSGYPAAGYPPMGYPPMGYPQAYYPPVPQQSPVPSPNYSNAVINHMPPSGRVDKLHGPQAVNKKSARDAFMSGDFGI